MKSVDQPVTVSLAARWAQGASSFLRAYVDVVSLKALALLTFTVAVAHFLLFRQFGLYSDDYTFISRPFGWDLQYLVQYILFVLRTWPIGRPIGFILPELVAYFAAHAGGLPTVYLIGAAILILNSFLVYSIVKPIGPETLALTAALAYALFPADTTRPFAMHATGLQTSMTFMLAASLLNLSNNRALSYLVATASLLTYESAFMPFLAVPLLNLRWNREFSRSWVKHLLICAALVIGVFLCRRLLNETRISALTGQPFEMVLQAIGAMVMGPIVSMSTFVSRIVTPWLSLDLSIAIIIFSSFAIFAWRLLRTQSTPETVGTSSKIELNVGSVVVWLKETKPSVLISSLAMLSLGYALSFTHFPPFAVEGQQTSVHLAASFGASLLFAWICYALWNTLKSKRNRVILAVFLALYLATLVGFGFIVQRDYRSDWAIQKQFWQQTIRLVPDMNDGTVILAVQDHIPKGKYISTTSWADPIMLPEMFTFPANWQTPPRVYRVSGDWASQVQVEGGQFKFYSAGWPDGWVVLPPSEVVVIENQDGNLVRRTDTVEIQGHPFALKPVGSLGNVSFRKGVLYDFLLGVEK